MLSEDTEGPCADLRAELAAQGAESVDIVVVVPDSEAGESAAKAVTGAAQMWQQGMGSMTEAAGAPAGSDIHVSTVRLAAGESAYPVLDAEMLLVAATVADPGDGGPALELYDDTGARCAVLEDPLALDVWAQLPSFSGHHSLPEGIARQACGDSEICVAVNATFDPGAATLDPFEQFGLVGDEVGHCLRRLRP
ncbi:unannotated protein [freshwater metagenome]|uniref:Unannotated protein n=1 Tax=freshwater metagenome TaxID=449393 RepID=A0A6J6QYN2_9ZZZZ